MPQEDRPNTAVLFENKKKEKDTHPDRKGWGNMDCPHCGKNIPYWLSGWINTAKKSGERYMGLATTPKEEQHQQPQPQADEPDSNDQPPF